MIVQESADTRRSRARIWNALLGGNEAYEEDRLPLERLRHVAPDIDRLAIGEVEFIERAWRWVVGRCGVDQVIYCGAPIPPGAPPHAAVWEPIALGQLHKVVYVEPDLLLRAKGAGYLTDGVATVKRADPLDLAELEEALRAEIEWDQPVAVVAPSLLHWLDEDAARAWTRDLRERFPQGVHVIATHFLDPEIDSSMVLVEQLIQAFDSVGVLSGSPLAGGFFRRKAEIAELFDGWELVQPGVVPTQDWWPSGPQYRTETPCDRLMAGVVAALPRSP
jgi:hypothetical protein